MKEKFNSVPVTRYSANTANDFISTARVADVAELVANGGDHFHCFCYKVYYISNFKDFNTFSPAC